MLRKVKCLIGSAVAACLFSAPATIAAGDLSHYEAKAEHLLKETVSINSSLGFNGVPKVAAFLKTEFLAAGFPAEDIHLIPVDDTAALVVRYRGDGRSGKKPILLSAHMDVVTANPADWERDPFTLIKENGFYFGRGTSDNKFGVSVLTTTLIRLKEEGFVPSRDLILALSGDEETAMVSTSQLATKYRDLIDAEFALVADGGGGLLDEDGHAVSFSVDFAEKTYADFEVKATNPGGHSSRPRADNAIKDLTHALNKIFAYDFPVLYSDLTLSYFSKTADLVGGELGDAMRAFSIDPTDMDAVKLLRSYPSYIGSTGTTCVPTMISGGHAPNALPQSATATINCRIFPGVGVENTLKELKAVVGDDTLEWTILDSPLESEASPLREDIIEAIEKGVHASYPDLPVIPHMASGASDAMHFRAAGIPSYTFSGIFMKSSDSYAHGLNERVPVATLPVALKMWHSILTDLAG